MKDELEREKYPRMPWHDVHCALWGPPCRDIARHFVQRWNHAKVDLLRLVIFFFFFFIIICQTYWLILIKHTFREAKLQMNKTFHYSSLITTWFSLTTWEEVER